MKTEEQIPQHEKTSESRAARAWRLLGFVVPANGARTGSTGAGQSQKILIVDDDPIILQTTSSRLKAAGHQVSTAADGAEAIAAVRDENPDVVLLDINFPPDVANGGAPAWDGFRLMYWLRGLESTKGARFVFTSGTDSRDYQERVRNSGALGFLPKPIDHQRLLKLISQRTIESNRSTPQRWWVSFFELL